MKTALLQLFVPCVFVLMSCGGDDPTENVTPTTPTTPNTPTNPADKKCLLQKQVMPSTTWTIIRNTKGLVTSIVYAYKTEKVEYNTTSLVEYDGSDRVVKITGDGYSITYEYDSQGKIVREKYSANYDPKKSYTSPYEKSYSYDGSGHLVKIAWSADDYERYEYDSNGNLIKEYMRTLPQAEYLRAEYLSYDDKKGVFVDFPFQTMIYSGTSEVYTIITSVRPIVNKHNITGTKLYQLNGSSTTQSTAYSYNEFGYPTSVIGADVTLTYECK